MNTLLARRRQSMDLMDSMRKLEESNRALEQFAYAASHDLQEPLRMGSSYPEFEVESLPRVRGDPDQLRQLLQNLLGNAIEYSGDGDPRVEVAAERRSREDVPSRHPRDGPTAELSIPLDSEEGAPETDYLWVISVSDDGVGIPPDEQERIFEVFQRLHTREECSGTGIGLALCKRIVDRHDGEIWVKSEPGEGSPFRVALPPASSAALPSS